MKGPVIAKHPLLMAVISVLDEAAIAAVILGALRLFGIRFPLWIIAVVAALLVGWAAVSYSVLKRNPRMGFESMTGAMGVVIQPLSPRGVIRIGNELWAAESRDGTVEIGTRVLVVQQHGLLLTVTKAGDAPPLTQI